MPQIGFFSGAPGPGELILVFLVVLLLFGPRKLPEFARTLGSLMQQLRRASNDFRDQLMSVEEDVKEGVRNAIEDLPESDLYEDESDLYESDLDDAIEDLDDVEVVTDDEDKDREDEEDRPLAG
ncbi:MAG: twin-arginine translocase TatA/TatE family subunit [Kiritimatiellae bacterium]|nr:twin-arginine translocase TatA/TatE family subunit [Kiritimatiellia bacterium]